MANPASQFREFLQNAFGQPFPMPVPDGRPHCFYIHDDELSPLKGWYILRLDGDIASGCFGSWKATDTWRSNPADP